MWKSGVLYGTVGLLILGSRGWEALARCNVELQSLVWDCWVISTRKQRIVGTDKVQCRTSEPCMGLLGHCTREQMIVRTDNKVQCETSEPCMGLLSHQYQGTKEWEGPKKYTVECYGLLWYH